VYRVPERIKSSPGSRMTEADRSREASDDVVALFGASLYFLSTEQSNRSRCVFADFRG